MVNKLVRRTYALVSAIPWASSIVECARDWRSLRAYKARGYFSQHKEDTFLLEHFGENAGTYIDIGANHPFRISNTYLLYLNGWSGITVEPIPHLSAAHKRFRPRDTQLEVAVGSETGSLPFYFLVPGVLSTFDQKAAEELLSERKAVLRSKLEVPIITLRQIFQEQLDGKPCDVLSVDTEGFDLDILKSNDWTQYRPKIVIFEANSSDESENSGGFLSQNGYHEIAHLGCNHIFAADEHCSEAKNRHNA